MDQKATLIDKKSHQGIEINASDKIQLSAQNPSVVQLKISSEDIKEYKKEGNNLVVVLKSGELITIMGFFDADNSLVLQDDVNHKLLWVEFSSNGEALSATYAELNDVGPLLYGENDAASPWAWAAVPLTAGGILAWAGHDSGNDSDKGIGETNEGPSAPESVVIGNGDEWITADEIDADGKVDVKIDLPADAVAGDRVIVNGEETVLTADDIAAGEIIVKVDAPNEGETLEVDVIIKDKDGNESDPTQAEATVDTTAPSAPDSVIIGNGDEWISADEIDADGKVDVTIDLPVDVVAGDSVIVNGEETVLTADDITAGEIIVKVDSPNEGETLEVEVSIKDAAGNESDEVLAEATVDSVLPVVEIEAVTPIDNDDPADGVADQVLITGTSDEPNAPVVIKDKDGNTIWEGETDGTGAFSATVDTAAVQAGDDVTVEVTDKAGNTGTDTATAGDLIFTNDPLVLVDDAVSTSLVDQSVDTTNKLATYNEGAILGILEGQSQIGKVNFDVTGGAKDAVIVVESTNLVTVANAFSFEVVNNATGEVFTVAAASSSQGGLIAGALGLQALGVVDDGSGLRLDIKDLPEGNYSVIVHGDSSKLADILETVKLSELGSNTVNDVIQDTVKGLVKDVLVNADDTVLEGILEQLTLQEVLDLAKTTNVSTALINTLETLLNTVDTVLSLLNPFGDNTAVAAELLNTSVGDILAGNSTGLLGSLISTLGLGATLGGLVNGLLAQVDNLGEVIYNEVVEPLIDDVITDALLQDTGLADLLGGLLGGINQILSSLGLGGLLPAADDLLTIVAENILSNPVSLFPDITADVYAVNEKTYVAEGNVLANDDVVNGLIIEVNGVPITFNQTDVNGNYAIITGNHGTLHLYEDGHYIYTSTVTSGNATSVVDDFTYTVQDEYNNTEDAVLTITTDPVNETIDFSGTASDDILQGGAGDDILTGGDGADTAIYYLLDNADATGGNGTDTWTDFELGADADKIDISALLDGLQTSANIGDYISVETNADGKAVISIDRDGASNGFSASDLLVLDNISPADLNLTNDQLLNSLLNNNQIVY